MADIIDILTEQRDEDIKKVLDTFNKGREGYFSGKTVEDIQEENENNSDLITDGWNYAQKSHLSSMRKEASNETLITLKEENNSLRQEKEKTSSLLSEIKNGISDIKDTFMLRRSVKKKIEKIDTDLNNLFSGK